MDELKALAVVCLMLAVCALIGAVVFLLVMVGINEGCAAEMNWAICP